MEKIRSIFSHVKLTKRFWDEALKTDIDFINLSLCMSLNWNVTDNVWTGKDIFYKHLRVFACRTFVHVLDIERSKLNGKTNECIFLGYPCDRFGYMLWDLLKQKVFRSLDVTFFEDQNIEDIKKVPVVKNYVEVFRDYDKVIYHEHHNGGRELQEERAKVNVNLLVRQEEE